ncbi:hypothetical protein E2C01_030483 [Portunus trituberculatus]|uniref:Uncharacterized protein n=1 Tax=Portunus trituberculatus TaxID=210409 RepID=A0A5B7ES64_PORTR|nr:hypothetical protein [Portunus trituberculatus]
MEEVVEEGTKKELECKVEEEEEVMVEDTVELEYKVEEEKDTMELLEVEKIDSLGVHPLVHSEEEEVEEEVEVEAILEVPLLVRKLLHSVHLTVV